MTDPAADPQPRRCDALTVVGEPCRRDGSYPVVVDGRHVELCGVHMRMHRRGWVRLTPAAIVGDSLVTTPGHPTGELP